MTQVLDDPARPADHVPVRHPQPARRHALQARIRAWLARSRASARDEARALSAVASLVVAVSLLRAVMAMGVFGPDDGFKAEVLWRTLRYFTADALPYSGLALLVYFVVQQVRRRGAQAGWRRTVGIALALVISCATAAALRAGYLALIDDGELDLARLWTDLPPLTLRFLVPAAMLAAVGEFLRREQLSLEGMRAAEAARQALETQTLRARLRTLEAQIEPHFLFNTLANVRRLYETDAVAGEAMMERMLEYLRMALPSMRGETVTLAREAELIRAYLELQKVRMGRRLQYGIDVAPALGPLHVPPMMLLTLVENAIKHGIAPARDGGRIDVVASLDGTTLTLEVRDSGRGFGTQTSGGGTGLANIRARLAALFGAAASLALAPQQPRGVIATLRLPANASAPASPTPADMASAP